MRKRDVLGALTALTGGLFAFGEGPALGVLLVALGTLSLATSRSRPSHSHLSAVMAALSR